MADDAGTESASRRMRPLEAIYADHEARQAALEASGNPFAEGIALIDGAFMPIGKARIPLQDQGFLHGDLTYDVPAVWDGRYFRLDAHLDRFEASCAKLRLRNPIPRAEFRAALIELVARSGIRDAYVEMIVTRGLKFVRQAEPGEQLLNACYIFATPYVWAYPPSVQRAGGSAVVTRSVRRTPPGAMDPTIKNLQWGDFIRGLQEAQDRGSTYPILTDGDGNLTEGSGYNVFVVKDGVLKTPDRGVLEGVTRRTVLEIAAAEGWPTVVDVIPVAELYSADEIFFSTTAGGVCGITELDGQPVGDGQVGPVTLALTETYWNLHYDPKLTFAVDYRDAAPTNA